MRNREKRILRDAWQSFVGAVDHLEWGGVAMELLSYTKESYGPLQCENEPLDQYLVDMLADMMHFAVEEGISWEAVQRTAVMHFDDESNGVL